MFKEKSLDELIEIILGLMQKIEELQKRLESKESDPPDHPAKKAKKRPWKKLGAPVGHPGKTREKPTEIHHIDETGWKIAGTNHWLWDFVNERLALYCIRRSRGRNVPQEILGKDYQGIVISDFLSADDKSGRLRQRCLVHLKREMKRVIELDTSQESQGAYKKLNRLLNDAYRLDERRLSLHPVQFFQRLHRLNDRLLDFACQPFRSAHWHRLSKRFLKYHNEIFTFLKVPGLPSHDNHAERMIRPNVIFRKISFENMSLKGAWAHETLMSLLQTLRLQKSNPISFFKQAYLAHRKGSLLPLLTTKILLPSA